MKLNVIMTISPQFWYQGNRIWFCPQSIFNSVQHDWKVWTVYMYSRLGDLCSYADARSTKFNIFGIWVKWNST